MLFILFTLVPLALLVFALVDAITTDDSLVRHLPKVGWIILIVLLPLAGSLAWLLAGKERGAPRPAAPSRSAAGGFHAGPAFRADPAESDEERIEREIAFHENEARIRRLEEELARKRRETGGA